MCLLFIPEFFIKFYYFFAHTKDEHEKKKEFNKSQKIHLRQEMKGKASKCYLFRKIEQTEKKLLYIPIDVP